jgi:hypothetical protein
MKGINEIKDILRNNKYIFDKYGVDLIGVFGSFVRGDAGENSDIDILINPDGSKPFGIFALMRLEEDLNGLLGVKVDLAIKRALKPAIGRQIMAEVVEV